MLSTKKIFRKRSILGYLKTLKLNNYFNKRPLIISSYVDNLEIKFSVHNWLEYHNRALYSYSGEPDMVFFIKNYIQKDDVLWDIGANVGAYSLLAAKMHWDKLNTIVAIEPYIPTFAHLWENISLNNSSNKIIPLCCALSDISSLNFLGISDSTAGSSQHELGNPDLLLYQPCLALRGDLIINTLRIPSPTILKIDVDGFELNVLKGLTDILGNTVVHSIIVEVDRVRTQESVTKFLQSFGYNIISNSFSNDREQSFNMIFQRNK